MVERIDEWVDGWMNARPVVELSFAELWVPARVTTAPISHSYPIS